MSYEYDLVERAVQVLAPHEPSLEGLLRRRDRKRRNQRLAAGAVGLAIGIGVMVLASAFLRSAANRETGELASPRRSPRHGWCGRARFCWIPTPQGTTPPM